MHVVSQWRLANRVLQLVHQPGARQGSLATFFHLFQLVSLLLGSESASSRFGPADWPARSACSLSLGRCHAFVKTEASDVGEIKSSEIWMSSVGGGDPDQALR